MQHFLPCRIYLKVLICSLEKKSTLLFIHWSLATYPYPDWEKFLAMYIVMADIAERGQILDGVFALIFMLLHMVKLEHLSRIVMIP